MDHYHVIYTDRQGATQTGRVAIASASGSSTSRQRSKAESAAAMKWNVSRRNITSLVRVHPPKPPTAPQTSTIAQSHVR